MTRVSQLGLPGPRDCVEVELCKVGTDRDLSCIMENAIGVK